MTFHFVCQLQIDYKITSHKPNKTKRFLSFITHFTLQFVSRFHAIIFDILSGMQIHVYIYKQSSQTKAVPNIVISSKPNALGSKTDHLHIFKINLHDSLPTERNGLH